MFNMIDLLPWAVAGIFVAIAVFVLYERLTVSFENKKAEQKKTTDELEKLKKEIQKPLVELPDILSEDPFGFEQDEEKK